MTRGETLVLVNIIEQSGSAPRGAGARMLVFPDGSIKGTIGGGGVEAEALKKAQAMLRAGTGAADSLLHFSLTGTTDMDMLCGGSLTVLLERIVPGSEKSACFAQAARAAGAGYRAVRLTALLPCADAGGTETQAKCRTRSSMFFPDGEDFSGDAAPCPAAPNAPDTDGGKDISPPLRNAAAEAVAKKSLPVMVEDTGTRWFVEPFLPAPATYIFGAGHVSVETAALAARTGFRVVVVDDRPEFAAPARFPLARTVVLPSLQEMAVADFFATNPPGADDAVIIITRGHAFDRDVLAATLGLSSGQPGYIGMIGSRTKRESTYATLRARGVPAVALAAVHSPIGLDIGAQTPEEIAVSIAAELIAWRRGKLR